MSSSFLNVRFLCGQSHGIFRKFLYSQPFRSDKRQDDKIIPLSHYRTTNYENNQYFLYRVIALKQAKAKERDKIEHGKTLKFLIC